MLFLNCGHQNYEWGRFSSVSLVFKIQNSNPNLLDSLDMKARYAELWIGTHINLPSFLQKYPSQSLADFLQKTPELLGETVKSFDNTAKLPFIMKILSVGKSLSIQAHPDKELAFKLNSSNPEIYKDANHKPEIAIALTKFEALCNFAPFTKILENFKNYQEFEELFPKELLTKFIEFQSKESLQKMVKSLFHTPKDLISQNIEKMIIRLTKKGSLTERDNLIMRLHEQFPFDIGVFFSLFMNYTVLSPGECLIMKPNEPHAYLDGECIECRIIFNYLLISRSKFFQKVWRILIMLLELV